MAVPITRKGSCTSIKLLLNESELEVSYALISGLIDQYGNEPEFESALDVCFQWEGAISNAYTVLTGRHLGKSDDLDDEDLNHNDFLDDEAYQLKGNGSIAVVPFVKIMQQEELLSDIDYVPGLWQKVTVDEYMQIKAWATGDFTYTFYPFDINHKEVQCELIDFSMSVDEIYNRIEDEDLLECIASYLFLMTG